MRWFGREEPEDAARARDSRPTEPEPLGAEQLGAEQLGAEPPGAEAPEGGPAAPSAAAQSAAAPSIPAHPSLPQPAPSQAPARHRADEPYPQDVRPPAPTPPPAATPPQGDGRPPRSAVDPAALPAPDDDPNVVEPITRDRVEDALRRHGYRYATDPAGMLRGNWDGNGFTIDLVGSPATVLQVRGTWSRALDQDLAPGLAQVVNDWNRDRIWPKVYTRTVNGRIRVHSEVSVDLGPGASDAQIDECLACGLGTGVQLFTQLTGLIEPDAGSGPVDGAGPADGRRPD